MPAMNGQISPPNTPLVDANSNIRPEWYRYLVQRQRVQDGISGASVLTVDPEQEILPNARTLEVATGELTRTTGDDAVTLGLADTAVAPGDYGSAAKLIAISVDAKGRIIDAQEFELNSDNVVEGATNLFFTVARARNSVSGASGITYNTGTGVFSLNQSFTRNLFSGSSGVTYNNGTGAFTVDQSFVRGLFSGGSGINYNSGTGVIATTGFSGTVSPVVSATFVDGICTAAS